MDEHKQAAEWPEDEPERTSAASDGEHETAFALPAWLDEAIENSQRSEPSVPEAETWAEEAESGTESGVEAEAWAPLGDESERAQDRTAWTDDTFLAATRDLGTGAGAEPSSAAPAEAASDTTFSLPKSLFDQNRDVPSFLPARDRDREPVAHIPITPVEIATLSPQPNLALSWIVAALLLAGAAVAVLVTMRMVASRQPTTTGSTSAPATVNRRAGTVKPMPAQTGRTAEQAPLPVASPAAIAAPTTIAAPASTRYGINVGTFRSDERATTERARLASITGLPTRTVSVNENGVTLFRVVIGSFENHGDAEKASEDLIQRSLVPEAFVVSIADSTPATP